MSDTVKPPPLFWVISVIALAWYLMGSFAYISSHSQTVETLTPIYGDTGTAILMDRPMWQVVVWAVAVFAGLIGSLGLLLRKSWSKIMFVLSLLGGIGWNAWIFSSGFFEHGMAFDKVLTVLVIVIPIFLIWFAGKKAAKGYLT